MYSLCGFFLFLLPFLLSWQTSKCLCSMSFQELKAIICCFSGGLGLTFYHLFGFTGVEFEVVCRGPHRQFLNLIYVKLSIQQHKCHLQI